MMFYLMHSAKKRRFIHFATKKETTSKRQTRRSVNSSLIYIALGDSMLSFKQSIVRRRSRSAQTKFHPASVSGHYSPQHVVAFMDGEECNSTWYHTQNTRQKPSSPPWLPELIGCAEGEASVNVDDMDGERLAKWRRMVFEDARQDHVICF
ncbi:uncharacterized protein [Triticum aestivum]|uniref:uncharacterized protein isoform X2 n=1 Tax=Triticum aestivum TaxID=4565 RepID=UPI001D02672B|nr:uncharacterized protein LOC123137771 isoform X2 [Triticum aestivum]